MRRRTFLQHSAGLAVAGALPAVARPAVAQGSRAATLRMVPQANLSALDPIWTTATVTSNHGFYVFDTLFGLDAANRVQPQMAEGYEVLEDGRRWRFRLREGLRFHDGEPVRAADCIASLRRWATRDPFGQLVAAITEEWRAVDDRGFELRLNRAFPALAEALAKSEAQIPFIMPERLARTPGTTAITEMVGSGPYRFLPGEFNSGSRVAYARFDGYLPRQEAPSGTAGGKVAHFPRIEWHIITDPSTAAAALIAGEVDWWERPLSDLQPLLAGSRDVRREVLDKAGRMALARLNCLQPPFDDVRLRQAVLKSVVQEDYMRAAQGDDPSTWNTMRSLFPRRTPYYADQADLMPGSLEACKAALKAAGYANQKVVIINPTDFPDIGPLGQVTADALRRAGMNVDLAESDWGTVIQRRNSREPVEKGGWSMFHTTGGSGVYSTPATSPLVRGQGEQGWFGWWRSDRAEALTQEWLFAPDTAAQARVAQALGRLALEEAATLPLGQFSVRTAFRKDLTGFVEGSSPFPWGVRRG